MDLFFTQLTWAVTTCRNDKLRSELLAELTRLMEVNGFSFSR